MKYLILILFFPIYVFSQSEDLILKKMCEEFKNTSNLPDSSRVENMYSKYLYPHLLNMNTKENIDSIGTSLYIRLQKECEEFRTFLIEKTNSEHWEIINEMPKSEFTKKQQKEFNKIKAFYYYEGETNEITNVILHKNLWVDHFPNHTFSKNYFKWNNENQFVLEFIESNNEGRKAYSRKGEKYFYQIINKKDNYYIIASQIPNQKEILVFKLYIQS